MENVVIVGAGAMGCLFAARLSRAGKRVTLVDIDEPRLARIAREGIALHDDLGTRTAWVKACTAASLAGEADLVLLFTKAMHSAAAIRSVAHLNDGRCCALTLQNGLGNAEAIAEIFSPERVLLGVTDWPADLIPPNGVASHGSGHVWLGASSAEGQPHARAAAALLDAAGMNALVDPAIQAAVWEKAAFNAALNALATILGKPVGALDCPEGRRLALAVADETIATAAARGIRMDRARLAAKIDFALAHHKAHKPSMLQDRLAGRPTEIEAINGQIVSAATIARIPTPVTAVLADLVRMATLASDVGVGAAG